MPFTFGPTFALWKAGTQCGTNPECSGGASDQTLVKQLPDTVRLVDDAVRVRARASPIGSNVVVRPIVMTQNDRIASLEAECAKLRSENDRLRAIIERPEVREATLAPADGAVSTTAEASVRYDSPTAEVTLFRSLFRGREDIYPIRRESKAGRSGYSPACNNSGVPGTCRASHQMY